MGMSMLFRMVKQIWEVWDIRGYVLGSLFFQVMLTLFAPLRKCCANWWLHAFLWAFYLAADSIALIAIGKISSNISTSSSTTGGNNDGSASYNPDMLGLWAPFLLLHLGGPDTITALALEDNQLWPRHFLQLIMQTLVTLYVIVTSLRNHLSAHKHPLFSLLVNHTLLLPTLLIFIDGFCKYWERIYALYHASADNFRKSLHVKRDRGPNLSFLVQEHAYMSHAHIPTTFEDLDLLDPLDSMASPTDESKVDQTIDENTLVRDAYHLYNEKFKGILADQQLSTKDSHEIRKQFLNKAPQDHLSIAKIQLNFIYDAFYTKVVLLESRWMQFSRVAAFFSAIGALVLFCKGDKTMYKYNDNVDVGITFTLLIGGLALDLVSTIKFLTSDWMLTLSSKSRIMEKLLSERCFYLKMRQWFPKRWSESMSAYSLLDRCCKDVPDGLPCDLLNEIFVGWFYVKPVSVGNVDEFILDELRHKAGRVKISTDSDFIRQVCSGRGNLETEDEYVLVSEYLRRWTVDIDFDESLLTWHLATDLCYYSKDTRDEGEENKEENEYNYKEVSKKVSDYMMYLIQRERNLVSSLVGMSDVRFEDTYKDVKNLSKGRLGDNWCNYKYKKVKGKCRWWWWWCKKEEYDDDEKVKDMMSYYCEEVLKENTGIPPLPITPKDHKSKSVYFEACYLANQLKMLGDMQWKITAKVWVEMICYAALKCTPRAHIAVLNRGGQLITIVWLLMNHLGFTQYLSNDRGLPWWVTLSVHK